MKLYVSIFFINAIKLKNQTLEITSIKKIKNVHTTVKIVKIQ